MAQEKMKQIVLQLKQMREDKGLTMQNIADALDKTNNHLAFNTVVKFFSEGSEDCGYQYETIRAIADVMLNVYGDDGDDAEVKGLKSTIQLQNILIDQLKEQLKEQETESGRILEIEKESHMRRIEFLRDRVEKQDSRIEQKDRLITIMMILILKKLDPDFVNGCGLGKYFVETMGEVSEYLGSDVKE